jgi:hypothetical protein
VGFLIAVLTVALLAAVVYVVSAPVRRARRSADEVVSDAAGGQQDPTPGEPALSDRAATAAGLVARDELDAAREAKYREIRDAELDYRTGKLSRADYEAIDSDLRAEALELLNRLERLRPKGA